MSPEPELQPVASRRTRRGALRQIGEVAEIVGLSLRSVRFYEEAGLVVPAGRTVGGFRLYDDDCIERFRIIMQMKPLGFTLEEMRLLIDGRAELERDDLDPARRTELLERRAMFATLAREKVVTLRTQLEIAERFSAALSEGVAGPEETAEPAGPEAAPSE